MNKFIKIGMILAVLLSMVGFASAGIIATYPVGSVDVNIVSNAPALIKVTDTNEDQPLGINATLYDKTSSPSVTTTDFLVSLDYDFVVTPTWFTPSIEDTTVYMVSQTQDATTLLWTTVWHVYIKDAGDGDDQTQSQNDYGVEFRVRTAAGFSDPATVDMVFINVTPVPEFPTIALPVAAILGLAFIIQRRREED